MWACRAGCGAYKRRLAYSVTVRIFNFILLLKSFIMKYKASLNKRELNLYALLCIP